MKRALADPHHGEDPAGHRHRSGRGQLGSRSGSESFSQPIGITDPHTVGNPQPDPHTESYAFGLTEPQPDADANPHGKHLDTLPGSLHDCPLGQAEPSSHQTGAAEDRPLREPAAGP